MTSLDPIVGRLNLRPALDAPELLAEPVREALAALVPEQVARCGVAEIDPAMVGRSQGVIRRAGRGG